MQTELSPCSVRRAMCDHGRRAACLLVLLVSLASYGCLVLDVHPAYDDDNLAWDPDLLGKWHNPDDNVTVEIARGEWRSYKVHYEHPIEKGDLTGYLTVIGDERYIDVMPERGSDRGSFLIPVHAVLRVKLDGDRLEVTPLSYDWFLARVRPGRDLAGLSVAQDQKKNVLILSASAPLRAWLRAQPVDGPMFGASATFVRK